MKYIDGNNFIAHYLKNNISCAVGKIGITELNLIQCCMQRYYPPNIIKDATNIAGIYPQEIFDEFIQMYTKDLLLLNAMPIWNKVIPKLEHNICKKINAYPIQLTDIEPYFHNPPWSLQLKDKRVLIISPFVDSIKQQYQIKDKIWPQNILPDFELLTIKYPHAKTTNPSSSFNTTFEAINYAKEKMDQINYDVALVGCGGASIPLAIHAKRCKKIGIHLGGPLQILFGIRGARWDSIKEFHKFFNEHWVRPSLQETPIVKEIVEGGCYW